jgi:hypothetical protein
MRYPKLPGHSTMQLDLTLADVKWNPNPFDASLLVEEVARKSDYILRFKFEDFSTYWRGHKEDDVYTARQSDGRTRLGVERAV